MNDSLHGIINFVHDVFGILYKQHNYDDTCNIITCHVVDVPSTAFNVKHKIPPINKNVNNNKKQTKNKQTIIYRRRF